MAQDSKEVLIKVFHMGMVLLFIPMEVSMMVNGVREIVMVMVL